MIKVVPNDPLQMLGKQQLAELLQVNPWTVDRWRRENPDFPEPIWISDITPRWRRSAIESWLATRRKGGLAALEYQPRERQQKSVRKKTTKKRRRHVENI
jgi:predicted DNA-binding transcriptional regulator AlpA